MPTVIQAAIGIVLWSCPCSGMFALPPCKAHETSRGVEKRMPEDQLERKTYRKSPGRQYGYEYDPLQSQSGKSQSGSTASRSGVLLSQRPDPRRTRQLLRQSIIASRRLDDGTLEEGQPDSPESTIAPDRPQTTRHVHHSP